MQERAALYGVVTGWACLWACLGLLRLAGMGVGWPSSIAGMAGADPGQVFQVPELVDRLFGLAQIGVAAAFVNVLIPRGPAPPADRALGACAWAMIVLGIGTAADSITGHLPAVALDAVLFIAVAATAVFAGTADHRLGRAGRGRVFIWARKGTLQDDPAGALAAGAAVEEYRPPCRTSSQM